VPLLTAWRRFPYLDPGIPLELLPASWPGVAAGELFETVDRRLRDPAAEHARSRIGDPR
jgi:phenylacetic acid degradation operon negative regulatory protein